MPGAVPTAHQGCEALGNAMCRMPANGSKQPVRPNHAQGDDIMLKHILVAVGAGYSDAALDSAIERARECNAKLTALHVVDRLPWWATASIESDCGRTFALIDTHARKVAERAMHAMREAGIDGTCVTIDLPGDMTLSCVIARAARELDADLIVVGRSKTAHWRCWNERVSDAVSRYGNRRVMIVTNDAAGGETKATPLSFTIIGSTQRTFVPVP
jgi:nucleotide-binding universal stress UspA family protein